jgi:uncharacterized protein YecE (DUF72 family)
MVKGDLMAELRIGTCSWKFPSWEGLVYSERKGINYLLEYAQQYETVEIDQWFWSRFDLGEVRLPNPDDVEEYRQSVPDSFRFTVKAPNSVTLTHLYKQGRSDPLIANPSFLSNALMQTFLQLLRPLDGLLGPIMFQFEYLNLQKMSSQAEFQAKMGAFAAEMSESHVFAVEVRNGQYMNASHFEFLNAYHLAPVLIQGYWMPPIWEVYAAQRALILQQPVAVLRLMGPDRGAIEELTGKRWDERAAPKDDELPQIADMTTDLLKEGVSVYINVNNHYEGSAPRTIEQLRALL